jgi:hypothetical protein
MTNEEHAHLLWLREQSRFYEAEMEQARKDMEAAHQRFKAYERAATVFRDAVQIGQAQLTGESPREPPPIEEKMAPGVPPKKTTGMELVELTTSGQIYRAEDLQQLLSEHRGTRVGLSTARDAVARAPDFFKKVGRNRFMRIK